MSIMDDYQPKNPGQCKRLFIQKYFLYPSLKRHVLLVNIILRPYLLLLTEERRSLETIISYLAAFIILYYL